MKYTVYKHITPSGKIYIGITSRSVEERWKNGDGYRNNPYFWQAIQKWGWENIKHEIIATHLTQEDAEKLEFELISKYKTTDRQFGYNHLPGGDVTAGGWHHTDESKQKISDAGKGRKPSKKAYSMMLKRAEAKRTPVSIYDIKGNWIANTDSIIEAEKLTGVDNSLIVACCKKKYASMKNYIFKYQDDPTVITAYNGKRIAVCKFSRSGRFIKSYESVRQASEECSVASSHIIDSCLFKKVLAGDYFWLYEHEISRIDEKKKQYLNMKKPKRPIVAVNIENNKVVAYYSRISEAVKEGFAGDKISHIVRNTGRYHSTGGYKWRYATDDEIDYYESNND